MQRNKLVYALADAALVVSSDFEKGGTWAGAVEQLGKLHFTPVYVRKGPKPSRGLEALTRKGAIEWPEPDTPEALRETLRSANRTANRPLQELLQSQSGAGDSGVRGAGQTSSGTELTEQATVSPGSDSNEPVSKVAGLLSRTEVAWSEADIASELGVTRSQAREWLHQLVEEGLAERLSKPVRYRSVTAQPSLFDAPSHQN
jgi:predicted Rossmann fold nucleotide-binding protein DprA/Smf involved in DNA uptake